MKLTPGSLKPVDDNAIPCVRGIDGKYWCVRDKEETAVLTCWGKNAKKNAVFFAAAPEMYEALKVSLRTMEDMLQYIDESDLHNAIIGATQALAKAEGRDGREGKP